MLLTKHEDQTFTNQTVYVTGQAFIRCKFIACTLVLKQGIYHFDGCNFERCNWHIDWVLMWGVPASLRDIKALVDMLDEAQKKQPELMNPPQPGQDPQKPQ